MCWCRMHESRLLLPLRSAAQAAVPGSDAVATPAATQRIALMHMHVLLLPAAFLPFRSCHRARQHASKATAAAAGFRAPQLLTRAEGPAVVATLQLACLVDAPL